MKSGETGGVIAGIYGVSLADLAAANNGTDVSKGAGLGADRPMRQPHSWLVAVKPNASLTQSIVAHTLRRLCCSLPLPCS